MSIFRVLFLAAAPLLFVACGGSDYDARYDCEQTLACQGTTDQASIDQCTNLGEALFDALTSAQQKLVEEKFNSCKALTGCAYSDCASN